MWAAAAAMTGLDGTCPISASSPPRKRGVLHPPGGARLGSAVVLVDGDTGHGEALNVMAMVRAFEDAGAAAVHIEDQTSPKKCGHLANKSLIDAREAAAKIAAAVKARRHLYIIARTDAAESEGMDGAIARAKLYLEAGADADLPEAPEPRRKRSRNSPHA